MEPVNLMSELWFDHEPQLDLEALTAAVPGTHVLDKALVHPRFNYTYAGGEQSAIMTAFFTAEDGAEGRDPHTEQTWGWEEADAVLARCTHSILVAEMFGRVQALDERLEAYLPALCAAIEQLRPAAVWLPNSVRVVQPSKILGQPFNACVNVRLFNVEDSDDHFMDTIGLHQLDLPDFQVVFSGEEPNDIATFLYDCAGYLLEQGDVIEDGNTIGDRPWRCHFDMARVEPERRALTLSDA
ncbi:DUF4261 domain-containing protein [Solirubrobacter taibaiensis]|nr:DUF4261 domain-containing protein [Solirubrobacter taibaiensis]